MENNTPFDILDDGIIQSDSTFHKILKKRTKQAYKNVPRKMDFANVYDIALHLNQREPLSKQRIKICVNVSDEFLHKYYDINGQSF